MAHFASRNIFSNIALVVATCRCEHISRRSRAWNESLCGQAIDSTNRSAGAYQAQNDRCARAVRYVDQRSVRQFGQSNVAPRHVHHQQCYFPQRPIPKAASAARNRIRSERLRCRLGPQKLRRQARCTRTKQTARLLCKDQSDRATTWEGHPRPEHRTRMPE